MPQVPPAWAPPSAVALADSLQTTEAKLFPITLAKTEFYQGKVGDCQLLACLYAMSRNTTGRSLLMRMIQENGEGDFLITFPRYPQLPIQVSRVELSQAIQQKPPLGQRLLNRFLGFTESPKFQAGVLKALGLVPSLTHLPYAPYAEGDPGIQLMEIAYARLMKRINPQVFSEIEEGKITEIFNRPEYHSDAWLVLQHLTNQPIQHYAVDSRPGYKTTMPFLGYCCQNPAFFAQLVGTLNQMGAKPGHFIAIASTKFEEKGATFFFPPETLLNSYHDYAIASVDAAQKCITLVNPQDTRRPPVKVTYDQFFEAFNELNVLWTP